MQDQSVLESGAIAIGAHLVGVQRKAEGWPVKLSFANDFLYFEAVRD